MNVLVDSILYEHGNWGMDCARGIADSIPTASHQARTVAVTYIDGRKEVMGMRSHNRRVQNASILAMRYTCTQLDTQGISPASEEFREGMVLARAALGQAFGVVAELASSYHEQPLPDIPHVVPQLTQDLLSHPA